MMEPSSEHHHHHHAITSAALPTQVRAAVTGAMVGVLDVIFLWPFVTIAARRESGSSLTNSINKGKLWAGARTAAGVLIPYSIALETLTTMAKDRIQQPTPIISLVMAIGLQPIEKKLVIEQLLQTQHHLTPSQFWSMAQSSPVGPTRWISGGFFALWAREVIYISAINVVTPLLTTYTSSRDLAAFAIGFCAGLITAPLQTVNVLMKDERNIKLHMSGGGQWLRWWDVLFADMVPSPSNFIRRVYFGSMSRSLRIGGASVLWMRCREYVNNNTTL